MYHSRVTETNLAAPVSPAVPPANSQIRLDAMEMTPNSEFTIVGRRDHLWTSSGPKGKNGASVIDILANSNIRLDSVKRMTHIQNSP